MTSVDLTAPAIFTVGGVPITTSGVIAITYSGTALPIANGGTARTSLTAYAPLFGGTTTTGAIQSGTVGTSGQVLTSNGAGALPTFQNAGGGSGTVTVVGAGSLTSTALVTGGGSQTIQTAAATATMDSSGNVSTPGSVTTGAGGSAAGFVGLGQGTAPSAGTTNIKIAAPASVTSYTRILEGAVNSSGFYFGTVSGTNVTDTKVGTTGSGVVMLTTSPDIATNLTTSSTSFTALAGATTLLTIGGTGASASMFVPSTLDTTTSTTGAIRTSGGISAAKALNVGTTITGGGALSIGGTLTSTLATGNIFLATSGATGNMQGVWQNTGGQLYWGVESSAGGTIFTGSSAYASVIGTHNSTAFQIAANNAVVGSFSSTGLAVTGTGSFTGGIGSTTATTQSASDNSTKIATTAYADAAIAAGVTASSATTFTNKKNDFGSSLASDDTFTGNVISGLNNSGGVTQWDAVYLNSSSQWVKADANGSGTYPAVGIATSTQSTGAATTVLILGVFRDDGGTAWTPGGTLYLSTTAGALTQTPPSTTGDKVQVIGTALAAHTVLVRLGTDYGTAP